MKFLRIEYNIEIKETGEKIDPISFKVDYESEELVYLEEAKSNYPNPVVIYEQTEGFSKQYQKDVVYDMMIIAHL